MPASEHVGEVRDRVRARDDPLNRFGHVRRDRDRPVAADRPAPGHGRQQLGLGVLGGTLHFLHLLELGAHFGIGGRTSRDDRFPSLGRRCGARMVD